MAALGEALRSGQCPKLQKLNIRSNKAGAEGVAALGEALRSGQCPELQTLYIGSNNASQADLGDLAAACPELTVRD